ncbi:hypothetical protein GGD92_10685 [Pseudomonas protegens]|uniref:Uncharacterized protein n=1 Tax=Pseudomonas protegens TaxID=380021 RepID=A0A7G8YSM6_9PSED|nr:hypothetical protein [Pseudomonas protegens]QNH78674.1 hypothetical protein GGI48_05760 [Pseudomonas protegens]QNL07870.1 hypothetical protein GGD92_10685 [Pseudomonas protegens]
MSSHFSRFGAFLAGISRVFAVFSEIQRKTAIVVARFAHKPLQFSPPVSLILINGIGTFRMFARSRCLFAALQGFF